MKKTRAVLFLFFCAAGFVSQLTLMGGNQADTTVYYIEESPRVFVPDHCAGPPRDCYEVPAGGAS